jgi:hypothetical protein
MEAHSVIAKTYANPAAHQRSSPSPVVRQPDRSEQQSVGIKVQTQDKASPVKPVANAQGQKTGQIVNTTA